MYSCCCILDKKNMQQYWSYTILPILFFTIEEGLRWGRGIDWNLYYYDYKNFLLGFESDHELLFQLIWRFFAMLELPYPCVISFCSFLFIYSIFFFCKPYQGNLRYIIPFVVILCALVAENLIRWYMALSFFLIATRMILERKWGWGVFLFVSSTLIHSAMLISIPMLLIIKIPCEKISPLYVILTSILLVILFDVHLMERFSFFSNMLSLFSDRFERYDSDWLSGDSQAVVLEKMSWLNYTINMIPTYVILYSSWVLVKQKKIERAVYCLLVMAIIIKSTSLGLQLLSRYYHVFEFFIAITGGVVVATYLKKMKQNNIIQMIVLIVCLVYFIKRFYLFVAPLNSELLMGYVWNETRAPSSLELLYYYK